MDVDHVHALEHGPFHRCSAHTLGFKTTFAPNPWPLFGPTVALNERTASKLCFSRHQLHHFASVTSAALSSSAVHWRTGVITLKAWPPHTHRPTLPLRRCGPSTHTPPSARSPATSDVTVLTQQKWAEITAVLRDIRQTWREEIQLLAKSPTVTEGTRGERLSLTPSNRRSCQAP